MAALLALPPCTVADVVDSPPSCLQADCLDAKNEFFDEVSLLAVSAGVAYRSTPSRGQGSKAERLSKSEELLTRESEALQLKIDKMDTALVQFQQHRPSVVLQNSARDREAVPARAALPVRARSASVIAREIFHPRKDIPEKENVRKSVPAVPESEVPSSPSLVQSGTKAGSRSRGIWQSMYGDLVEWQYVGPHTLPHRNKVVLASIELVFPLTWFGLDRLYLGQPIMAGLKMLSFFCTCGVVGTIWAFLDMFVIAENCLLGEKCLHQFGMGACFGDDVQISIATVLGILVVIVWIGGYILLFCLIYPRLNWPDFEWFLQHPNYREHIEVNLARDPWLSSVNDEGHKVLNLARDPFDVASSPGMMPKNPYNSSSPRGYGPSSAYNVGSNSGMYQSDYKQPDPQQQYGMQPYPQQYKQKQRGGCQVM